MQDLPPSNPNPNTNSVPNASSRDNQLPPQLPSNAAPPTTATPPATPTSSSSIFIGSGGGSNTLPHHHHRRAHSEVSFRMPDDLMDLSPSDPFNAGSSTASIEEIGSEDDLFSTYIDVDKLGGCNGLGAAGNGPDQNGNANANGSTDKIERDKNENSRPRHRHSCSVDGSTSSTSVLGDIMEAKKAMPPDKLAELWTIDPKRAKRILANRQSAARSKERKARYIQELERKVQTLQTEATTLSAQLTLFQRDTTGLSNENTELKLRLQALEQQAQLRDALNETLKKEVARLKIATGEMTGPSESFNLGMHQMPFNAPNFFSLPRHLEPTILNNMHSKPFSHSQTSMPNYQLYHPNSHTMSDGLQNDQIGRLQGLDISSKGPSVVKSEGPSISASESSTTF